MVKLKYILKYIYISNLDSGSGTWQNPQIQTQNILGVWVYSRNKLTFNFKVFRELIANLNWSGAREFRPHRNVAIPRSNHQNHFLCGTNLQSRLKFFTITNESYHIFLNSLKKKLSHFFLFWAWFASCIDSHV